jgi:hypothetical protein
MDKPAINVAEALARLSALTTFELRGEWRRLHRMLRIPTKPPGYNGIMPPGIPG